MSAKGDSLRALMRASALPRLEAQMLWQHVLQVPRAWLISHDTDPLQGECIARYRALEQRRVRGEPMAYILGSREFMSHDFLVTPDVLIPRPDTEMLVEAAIHFVQERASRTGRDARVLDLGTGSGAIAISIALACPHASVVATDLSEAALSVARHNAARLGAQVQFRQGAWYDALPARSTHRSTHGSVPQSADFDLIVSNPPYIAAHDKHLRQGDVRFEPLQALTDGGDGLGDLRAIIGGAAVWLRPGGRLYLEHGWDQAQAVRDMLVLAGFADLVTIRDLAGVQRVSGGLYN